MWRGVLDACKDEGEAWERLHGGLLALRVLASMAPPGVTLYSLSFAQHYQPSPFLLYNLLLDLSTLIDAATELAREGAQLTTRLLSHTESRVRLAAGEALGALVATFGPDLYTSQAQAAVLSSIRDNLERDVDPEERERLRSRLGVDVSAQDHDIFHESAGWKNLESGCK